MTIESRKEQRHRRKKGEERLLKKQLRSDSVFHRVPSPDLLLRLLALLADAMNAQGEQSVGFEEFNRLNYFQEIREEFMDSLHDDICAFLRPQHAKKGMSELATFEDFIVVIKDMAIVHPEVNSMRRKKHRLIFSFENSYRDRHLVPP